MPTIDITASLTRFRTLRTLKSELRARESDNQERVKGGSESPKGKSTPQSVRNVRERERVSISLPPDQAAWLPVAQQILRGEFDGCDRSTCESLMIGLRSVSHPACRRALEKLPVNPAAPKGRERPKTVDPTGELECQ